MISLKIAELIHQMLPVWLLHNQQKKDWTTENNTHITCVCMIMSDNEQPKVIKIYTDTKLQTLARWTYDNNTCYLTLIPSFPRTN